MLSVITITLAYILGIIWGLYLEFNILKLVLIFLFICVLCFILRKKELNKIFFNSIILFLVFIIGIFYVKYKINNYNSKYITGEFNDTIQIISHKSETDYYYKYYAKNSNKDKFIIYFKKGSNTIFDIGAKVSVKGEFSLPNGSRNTGGFNYKLYLNSNNVYGNIYVSTYEIKELNSKNIIYLLQNKIRNALVELFESDINYAGILNGMLIGEVNDISDEIKNQFQISGITHLLAVSGSNVAIVIYVCKFLFSKIFGKKYSNYFSIIFIILFILLSGSSPSVVRAGIMAILVIGANILIRKSNTIYNIFTSALLILLVNPITLFNTGFILSFFGTIGIVSLSKYLNMKINKIIKIKIISETLSVTLSAQIVLVPIMAYLFNTLSLISIITNLLVVPVASVLTILGIILVLISIFSFNLAKIFSYIPYIIIKYILFVIKISSNFDFLNILVPTPRIWQIILYYSFLFIFVYTDNYKSFNYIKRIYENKKYLLVSRLKKLFYMLIISTLIISSIIKLIPRNYIKITSIDVGQGDSFLIETLNKKNILVDGGGSEKGSFDVGKNILLPYLLDKHITKLDAIFISHAHADHIDGIYTIIENLKVDIIIIGAFNKNDEKINKLYDLCNKNKVEILIVGTGDSLTIDNLKFEILSPDKNETQSNVNNLSLVMKMSFNNKSMLFTGDIEEDKETEIINKYANDFNKQETALYNSISKLKVDILKVAHHGAKTSSSEEFINATRPSLAIISVAEKNSYGHPNNEVVERIKKYAKVYMTKNSGELNIKIYKNGAIEIFEYIK